MMPQKMSVVYGIVKDYGGEIEVETEIGSDG